MIFDPYAALADLRAEGRAIRATHAISPAPNSTNSTNSMAGSASGEGVPSREGEAAPNPDLLRERAVVEWLNANPAPSEPGACAWCGGSDGLLLPFLAGESHTWLHGECWADWYAQRWAEAEVEL